MSAVQISEYAIMKNGGYATYDEETGNEINSISAFWQDAYKPYIRTINFGSDLSNLPSSCTEENLCWDISESPTQKKKVYGYLVDTGLKDSTDNTESLYNLYIVSEAPIFAPADCSYIFNFAKIENGKSVSNLIKINFNGNFNTSKVTYMSYMFYNCSSLTSLDFSSFNTSNVTNMKNMFWDCSSLTSLDLSSFNTSKVTNMSYMFYNCSSLTGLDLSSFNTSKVTDMGSMFSSCSSLTSLDLSSFNTSNVTDMSFMFFSCSSLTGIDLSSFNTSKVTDMSYMFYNCKKLTTQINIMNTGTTSYSNMFSGAASDPSAHIIIGYTTNTQSIAEAMRNTCTDATAKARIELKKID